MVGLIGAMEDEIALLKQAIENPFKETIGDFEFFSGDLGGKPVVLLRCGIGKVNAAVGCALLINRFDPAIVINTGSAGGIDPALSYGDVIVSDGLMYFDVDVTAFNYEPGQLPGMPTVYSVPENLVVRAERAIDELKREGVLPASINHRRGCIGSGDIFVSDAQLVSKIKVTFPAILAVEMEGTAIAQTCSLFKIPAIIIRALSDVAGVESPLTFDEFLPLASKHSAEIVRRIVKNY
ncbi:5'-methylthioadenosine/S-adenosylhomocysteine nucleosidase [Breznakiellaceae bacterium SP9]